MDLDGAEDAPPVPPAVLRLQQKIQHYLDKTIPWLKTRWVVLFCLLVLLFVRVVVTQGYFVVAYGLSVYLLNLLINFLSPAAGPEAEDGFSDASLPTRETGEFRPFVRKLPEFKFWTSAYTAASMANLMTLNKAFDLPVFWPILLGYFLLLFTITMKDRVKHMIKHKYVPFSMGKETYGDLTKVKVPAGAKESK